MIAFVYSLLVIIHVGQLESMDWTLDCPGLDFVKVFQTKVFPVKIRSPLRAFRTESWLL